MPIYRFYFDEECKIKNAYRYFSCYAIFYAPNLQQAKESLKEELPLPLDYTDGSAWDYAKISTKPKTKRSQRFLDFYSAEQQESIFYKLDCELGAKYSVELSEQKFLEEAGWLLTSVASEEHSTIFKDLALEQAVYLLDLEQKRHPFEEGVYTTRANVFMGMAEEDKAVLCLKKSLSLVESFIAGDERVEIGGTKCVSGTRIAFNCLLNIYWCFIHCYRILLDYKNVVFYSDKYISLLKKQICESSEYCNKDYYKSYLLGKIDCLSNAFNWLSEAKMSLGKEEYKQDEEKSKELVLLCENLKNSTCMEDAFIQDELRKILNKKSEPKSRLGFLRRLLSE